MPWISLDAGLLNFLGSVPAEPIPGYKIPALVREAGSDPLVQGGAAAFELLSGRLDLLTARVLFGERYEGTWAPAVVIPALLCLVNLFLIRLCRLKPLVRFVLACDVLVLGAVFLGAWRLSGEAGGGGLFTPTLTVHDGIWMTVAGSALTVSGAFLLQRTPRPGRRR